MFKSLYGKLVFWLFTILLSVSIALVTMANYSIPLYQQELTQKLHVSLAKNLVDAYPLLQKEEINQESLKNVFSGLMKVNPAIEVYLLDQQGKILAFDAPPGKVKLNNVNLSSVKKFLGPNTKFPVIGDNPRSFQEKKVFSAAPIFHNNTLEGYLYIVLGGDEFDSVVNMIKGSYILQMTAISFTLVILITFIAGILIFNIMTRRIRFLNNIMNHFKQSDFQQSLVLPAQYDGRPGDEISDLGRTFREMSERINQQVSELRATDKSRRELIANVSHDLRTPLSSLQGYLETLALKSETLSDQEKHEYIKIALKQSERLGRLIKELFELAMLENKTTVVQHESFSLTELAQDVSQKFLLEAKNKNINFDTHLPDDLTFVSADIALIERVLENLLENAIKYTPNGGKVSLRISNNENNIRLEVIDNGIGIPQEDIPRIFERFYRVEKSRSNSTEGTGLGLAIANRILQLHNSIINVSSKINQGTNFSFNLPHESASN